MIKPLDWTKNPCCDKSKAHLENSIDALLVQPGPHVGMSRPDSVLLLAATGVQVRLDLSAEK